MTKNVTFFFESQVALGISADESADASGKIEAMLTTWGAREGADGRRFNYQAAPFQAWAKEFANAGRPLPMYFQHNDQSMPVGQWDEFEFTDEGMIGRGMIYTNTTTGRDLYTIMKESPMMVGGVSVGAYADEYCMVDAEGNMLQAGIDADEEGYFSITKGGLAEVSIVMQPNNPMANISKLEYFRTDGTADLKVFEAALREVGFSRKDAKKAASVFGKATAKRDVMPNTAEPTTETRDADSDAANQILEALQQRELLKALESRLNKS
jgi:HK97 family phage prohead protease